MFGIGRLPGPGEAEFFDTLMLQFSRSGRPGPSASNSRSVDRYYLQTIGRKDWEDFIVGEMGDAIKVEALLELKGRDPSVAALFNAHLSSFRLERARAISRSSLEQNPPLDLLEQRCRHPEELTRQWLLFLETDEEAKKMLDQDLAVKLLPELNDEAKRSLDGLFMQLVHQKIEAILGDVTQEHPNPYAAITGLI